MQVNNIVSPSLMYLTSATALSFFSLFSPPLSHAHSAPLHHLSTLLLPSHVQSDELAQRFRDEKYGIRMSRSGFNLLVGWLTEGMGGEGLGVGLGFSGEKGKRGRSAVMRVVNNHLRFDGNCISQCVIPISLVHSQQSSNCLQSIVCIANCLGGVYRSPVTSDSSRKRNK